MNLYNKNALCAAGPNMKQRDKVVPLARGQVLEIGAGSGEVYRVNRYALLNSGRTELTVYHMWGE